MSETQDVKFVGEVENNQRRMMEIGINDNVEIEGRNLRKAASIDSSRDLLRAFSADKKSFEEETSKGAPKDEAGIDHSSRENSIDGARNAGECRNILPVLVENLCSSLETVDDISNEPLAPDPTHRQPPIQEATPSTSASRENQQTKNRENQQAKFDLNYFQDLCPSDIKAAISRLEETLKGVDIDALSSSPDLKPSEKLNLVQLIQNLVSNLKKMKIHDKSEIQGNPGRRSRPRGNRHTIGVSSEELASARKWLEQERGQSIKFSPENRASELAEQIPPSIPPLPAPSVPQSPQISPENYKFVNSISSVARSCDKHIKDAINQQQSLQHRSRDSDLHLDLNDQHRRCSADETVSPSDLLPSFYPLQPINNSLNRSNKFFAKKTKIKRANTIDIPNYLKMQAEKNKNQSNGFGGAINHVSGLRKPIDISDKISWNSYGSHKAINPAPVPILEPKTDNDRKFLALINKNNINNNNESSNEKSWHVNLTNSQPFRTFNYRQTSSVADKNWKSRFSNIKTAFDRQSEPSSPCSLPMSSRRSSRDHDVDSPLKMGQKVSEKSPDQGSVNSLRFNRFENSQDSNQINQHPPYQHHGSIVSKLPIFTHAATSPFKTISNPSPKYPDGRQKINKVMEQSPEKPISSCYIPNCASNGMLKAKVKMFDHQPEPSFIPRSMISNIPIFSQKLHTQKNEDQPCTVSKENKESVAPMKIQQKNEKNNIFHRNNDHYCDDDNNDEKDMKEVGNFPRKLSTSQSVHSVAVQTNSTIFPEKISLKEVSFPKKLSYTFGPKPMLRGYYSESENPIYIPPPSVKHPDLHVDSEINDEKFENNLFKHVLMPLLPDEKIIQNQDISPDKIVTRYTSAIGTLTTDRSESTSPVNFSTDYEESIFEPTQHTSKIHENVQESSKVLQPILKIREDSQQNITIPHPTLNIKEEIHPILRPQTQSISNLQDDAQRHNLLQMNLIRRLQEDENDNIAQLSPMSPPTIEANNTQDKINIFEEKSQIIPGSMPKINVINAISSTKVPSQPQFSIYSIPQPQNIVKPSSMTIDSSDEYLVSCANRPNRSIVLSKSESWHQLALCNKSKGHYLQVPPQSSQKPPKSNSPFSQRFSKNYETRNNGDGNSTMKKMEEKVQRYFSNNSRSGSTTNLECQQTNSSMSSISKRDTKSNRRSFSPKMKTNNLARSQTMPHIFDDSLDVDKAFDSLFEEATRDNRH